ncbi:AGE family epimerase/isomerase [Marinimicrobium sp. ABcell2]|uniref:AGE family epimerase/isomerase n=1 Tax=Marinimicrobium sp. ABcell2 TaxID=3069751 RepID=UPI0027AFECD9|nr:AGE family epimerase/isomerase [Marinimicrobium sp. ABcell2]MDQ2076056.1 AGE family epimerase/isomerase [Marinimicrobium sp. ABcell2]
MTHSLNELARRLEEWTVRDALPLWQRVGTHPERKGHYESLNEDGSPAVDSNVRVRVQARQAFVYAIASYRGWCRGEEMARQLIAFMEDHTAHPSAGGGFTHLLDANFTVIDARQDLYDHAFAVLAYAWGYRAFGDLSYLASAEALVAHLDARFGADFGGWLEGDYRYTYRRQNPHMHLLEAMLALYDATSQAKWLARAGELVSLFESRFFDPDRQVLFEFFEPDWSRSDSQEGQQVEPGHMMEWVWLLDWYSRRSGRSVDTYTQALYRKGLEIGLSESGLVYDAVTPDGQVLKGTKRCWGITELIKASLVRARAGDPDAEQVAARALHNLFEYYLCASTPGAYVDQRDERDEISVSTAPASTLYHLLVLLAEVQDYVHR